MKSAFGVLVLSLAGNSIGWCAAAGEVPLFRFTGLQEISEISHAPAVPNAAAVPWTRVPRFKHLLQSIGKAPYELVLEESFAKLSASKVFTAQGHFEKFSVTASIDKDDFSKSEISVSLDMNSAVSDSWFLSTKTLKSKLKAAEHPISTLKSLSVTAAAEPGRFKIESDLALMGENHKKMIPVTVEMLENGDIKAVGSFEMTVDGTSGTMSFSLVLRQKTTAQK